MSRLRSWLKLSASVTDRPLLLSQDIIRQSDVKDDIEDALRTDVFSTGPTNKDFEIKIDDDGAETVSVSYSDSSKTEDVLQVLRDALTNSRVLS